MTAESAAEQQTDSTLGEQYVTFGYRSRSALIVFTSYDYFHSIKNPLITAGRAGNEKGELFAQKETTSPE